MRQARHLSEMHYIWLMTLSTTERKTSLRILNNNPLNFSKTYILSKFALLLRKVSEMKRLKTYKIDIFGLKNGTHKFDFTFDDSFFAEFENSIVSKGKGICKILMIKTDSMITLEFNILGTIELVCDRSLELFDYPVDITRSIMYKYGDKEKELSEDVFVILKTTQEIRIDSFLYELINLEVPMKKLHPNFQDGDNEDELIFTSTSEEESEENSVDPRWEALKKLNKK